MDRLEVKRIQIRDAVCEALETGNAIEVRQIMTPAPHRIDPDASVLDLVKLLNRKGHRHLLVADDGDRLVGVISDRDVGRCFGPGKYPDVDALSRITAAEIMSSDVITISPHTALSHAVALMVDHGISCLPIVAGETLVGIMTDTDLRLVLQAMLTEQSQRPAGDVADVAL